MDNQNSYCNICKKRVTPHENTAVCNLCSKPSHLRCLPIYNTEDNNYATNTNGHWSRTLCLETNFPFFSIEDSDFNQQVTSSRTNHIHDFESLDNMLFHPFEINEIDVPNDLDPDENYYNQINQNISECKYYNFEQLNTETSTKPQNQFSNLCFNIRSLPKNYRKLITLLDIRSPIQYYITHGNMAPGA